MPSEDADVIIIGAGVSGLACAITLKEAGLKPLVLEKSNRTGGRVSTDTIGRYRIDRGFQILLSSYPELHHFLDMDALELGSFKKGAHIWDGDQWQNFYDPRSAPFSSIPGCIKQSPFNFKDYYVFLKFWRSLATSKDQNQLLGSGNRRTHAAIQEMGFSERAQKLFLKPFLGGVFLDPALDTSEKMFRFVMKMFIDGNACLPRGGMKHIAEQMTMRLGIENIKCETEVIAANTENATVETADGIQMRAHNLVLACDARRAHELCPEKIEKMPFNRARSFVFGAEKSYTQEIADSTLRLFADDDSPIGIIAIPSMVAEGYAPPEHEQIVVSLKDGSDLDISPDDIIDALKNIFGKSVRHWEYLQEHRITHALPRQLPADTTTFPKFIPLTGSNGNAWACGDYLNTRSLNGALESGRLLGEHILKLHTEKISRETDLAHS